jgi:integrase
MISLPSSAKLLCKRSGVSEDEITQLLTRLNAPYDCTRLMLVLTNMDLAFRSITSLRTIRENLAECLLFSSTSTAQAVLQALNRDTSNHPAPWTDDSTKQRGIINQHPEWAMLIMGAQHPRFNDVTFRQHQALVLLCCVIQRQRHHDLGSEITGACRNIRGFAAKSQMPLPWLPKNISIYEYHQLLCDDAGNAQPGFEGIELLVRKVKSNIGKTRSSNNAQQVASVHKEVVRFENDSPDTPGPESEVRLFQSSIPDTEQMTARTAGLHPGEFQRLSAVSLDYSDQSPTSGFDLRDHFRRQRAQTLHLSLANQRLPFRYSHLSSIELAHAAQGAFDLFNARGIFLNRSELDKNASLLLMLLIWLGRPVGQILDLRIYKNQSCLPKNKKDLLAYLIDEKSFVLPIKSPEWRNNLKDQAQQLLYRAGETTPAHIHDVIFVACPVRMTEQLNEIRHSANATGRAKYTTLFPPRSHAAIQESLSTSLSRLNREYNLRLTPLRISQALFDEVTSISTDWTDASLLTGHTYTTSEVTAHYYSVTGEYLQSLFHQAVTSLRNRLYSYLGVNQQNFFQFEQTVENIGDHGSKLNVKPKLLKLLVQHLKATLRTSKRQVEGPERWRKTHNALVSYLSFWILFSTGFRAVNDLVFRLREIDWQTGHLIISDKDSDAVSSARIVWLPPRLQAQFKNYLLHLEALQILALHSPTVGEHIEEILSTPRPDAALLFFISEQWHITQLSPENLRAEVPEFTLPINLGRHYLRTHLRKLGCQAEYVNAFLGHWQHGQDPFGEFSTLSPAALLKAMRPYFDQLQSEAGWTVQKGLGYDLTC